MRKGTKKGMKTGAFVFLCIVVFIVTFVTSIVIKISYKSPEMQQYSVQWSDEIGTVRTDLTYGEKPANEFDLYLPVDDSKESYGLVVYLHAGGFTSGDKTDDKEILQWLCSKGYVAAGINYTLRDDAHPEASVLSQSNEIKESIPFVIEEARKLGYNIDRMATAGGSAGGCLALIYAYRDASSSPVPVMMAFEGVGPTSFYPEDWKCYGFDQNAEAAAEMFSVMTGKEVTAEMFGTAEYDELVKDASALLWVNEDTVPTVMAYGQHDKFQPYEGPVRLDKALTENGVPHEYIVLPHSGHGLQNDNRLYAEYMAKVEEYLNKYMSE